jgi:hypothetical protein
MRFNSLLSVAIAQGTAVIPTESDNPNTGAGTVVSRLGLAKAIEQLEKRISINGLGDLRNYAFTPILQAYEYMMRRTEVITGFHGVGGTHQEDMYSCVAGTICEIYHRTDNNYLDGEIDLLALCDWLGAVRLGLESIWPFVQNALQAICVQMFPPTSPKYLEDLKKIYIIRRTN